MADQARGLFDLNVEQVLEHWDVAHALRELLANALDEHLLGHGGPPEVYRDSDGAWHIRDHGRGLRHEHFTQNENPEKLRSDAVVGRFGVGLKDAVAVLHRFGIPIRFHTATADISTEVNPKAGFEDTATLHAAFAPPSRPDVDGTDVVLPGVSDEAMAAAQSFFRHWNQEDILDVTRYGSILRNEGDEPARIYVRGVRVAEEESFLFSYDITDINTALARALNRERSHVGRTAYGSRVKDILLASASPAVMADLTEDLNEYASGEQHTESTWLDVAVHASRVLNEAEDIVFVTPDELAEGGATIDYARGDGKRVVVVPTKVASKLAGETDASGNPIRTLKEYVRERDASFQFEFVELEQLTENERATYRTVEQLFEVAGVERDRWPVVVTETMRPGMPEREAGLWDPAGGRIIIRRDQLQSMTGWAGTLLHEVVHATSGAGDATLEFENHLTDLIGHLAVRLLETADRRFTATSAPPVGCTMAVKATP